MKYVLYILCVLCLTGGFAARPVNAEEQFISHYIEGNTIYFTNSHPGLIGISFHLTIPQRNSVENVYFEDDRLGLSKIDDNTLIIGVSSKNFEHLGDTPVHVTFEQPLKKEPLFKKLRAFTEENNQIITYDFTDQKSILWIYAGLSVLFIALGIGIMTFRKTIHELIMQGYRVISDKRHIPNQTRA